MFKKITKRRIASIFLGVSVAFSFVMHEFVQAQAQEASVSVDTMSPAEAQAEYERLKSAIAYIEDDIESIENLLASKKAEFEKMRLVTIGIEEKIKSEEIDPEVASELEEIVRRNKKIRISQETDLHVFEIESNLLIDKRRNKLNVMLEKLMVVEKKLKSSSDLPESSTASFPLLDQTHYRLKDSEVIIEGEVFLSAPDDIEISLVLERTRLSATFCEVNVNGELASRERWNIGRKKQFKIRVRDNFDAAFLDGKNSLEIIFRTTLEEEGMRSVFPSFKKYPLVIFEKSTVKGNRLISAKFELRKKEN